MNLTPNIASVTHSSHEWGHHFAFTLSDRLLGQMRLVLADTRILTAAEASE